MENSFEQIAKEYGCNTPEELAAALSSVKKEYKYLVQRVQLSGAEGEQVSRKTILRTNRLDEALKYYNDMVSQYGEGPWTSFRIREEHNHKYETMRHSWCYDW